MKNQEILNSSLSRENKKILRSDFVAITGYTSDPSWYKFYKILYSKGILSDTNSHKQNLDNLRKVAKLYKDLPRAGVPLVSVIDYHTEIEKISRQLTDRQATGQDLIDQLRTMAIALPTSTRTEWFRNIGGYRRDKAYSDKQVRYIMYRAVIYLGKKNAKH